MSDWPVPHKVMAAIGVLAAATFYALVLMGTFPGTF